MWHQLRMLFLDFWRYCCQQPEIQKTILQEQSEDTQPQLVEIELSTETSEYPQTNSDNMKTEIQAIKHLRISIPRESGQSV